ncbi:MAG: chromosomal replication initiator protein DnaA [Candidatus Eisenbacteria bacterium]
MALTPIAPDETTRLWEQVLCTVKGAIESQQAFDTWFRPIVPLRLDSALVELEVPNPFFVDWIHEHHLPALERALAETLGAPPEVRLTAREGHDPLPLPWRAPAIDSPVEPVRPVARTDRAWLESQLNPRLTFENFIVGGSCEFTHAACRAVAGRPGHVYNPLFIFAGPGLGKTHLLHAIGHEMRLLRADARVYYVTAERFTNEMIYAIQHAQTLAFRNKYRSIDLLLIDDIQFLAGKESTQQEFFHTFNALRDAHKQVVVTADKPPRDLPMLEERLTSRFNQGLVCDIKQPDLETRLAILRHRYELEGDGVSLPQEAFLLIADRIRTNVRDLEGCLVRVLALGSLLKQEVTTAMVEEVLQTYAGPEADRLTPERVVTAVAEAYAIRPEVLFGRRRTQSVALPRQIAMYLLRHLTALSLVEIGRVVGGRDHTTVMYACERIGERITGDSSFSDKVNGIISTLSMG